MILQAVFWISVVLVLYTYLLYPALLWLAASIRHSKTSLAQSEFVYPSVSVIVAAYNEAGVIRDKIQNCFSLGYPMDRIEVLVGSDGSTDATNAIVAAEAEKQLHLRFFPFARRGKIHVINDLVTASRGEILIFSDANSVLDRDSLARLVEPFGDSRVGCVSGLLRLHKQGTHLGAEGESFYWRYETFKKRQENVFGAVAGANGGIYAVRRSLVEALSDKTINDDLTISMRVFLKGFKLTLAETAIAHEYTSPSVEGEFQRHVRDAAGHYRALIDLKGLLDPRLGMPFVCYVSHRVIRWMVPFLLVVSYASSWALRAVPFFSSMFWVQTLIYLGFLVGLPYVRRGGRLGLLYVPYYFLLVNSALLLGFVKFCVRSQDSKWEPNR